MLNSKTKLFMLNNLVLLIICFHYSSSYSQTEQFSKVILTRYFKPQVTYSVMTSPEFKKTDLKTDFFQYLNDSSTTSDDFRNFISFHQSKSYKEIPYNNFDKIPNNPIIPDRGLSSMLKTYFKFFISPILLKKVENKKKRIKYSVNNQLASLAEQIAKERILNIWGYNKLNYFDYDILLNEAKQNSNDLEDFTADNSAISNRAYKDLMVELINRNFIIIYNLRECLDYKEYYNAKNTPEHRRLEKNGINVLIEAYIFKINWTKEDESYFYENCWFDNTSLANKNKSLEAFKNMKISVQLVDIVGDEATEQYFELTDYESMGFLERGWRKFWNPVKYERNKKLLKENNYSEYLEKINKTALENVINNVHGNIRLNVDHFKLRSILSTNDGLSSRIGEKESLFSNQRFVAYEILQKQNGQIKKAYKGVLTSRTPVSNFDNKSLKSKFKQERGVKLSDGMILEEQELGLYGFSVSYFHPMTALQDSTFNLAFSLGFLNLNYTRFKILKGVNLDLFGVEFSRKKYSNLNNYEQFSNTRWRPSISRNIYIPRFPYINLNMGLAVNTLVLFDVSGITPFGGLNIPIGSNTSIQINANYGIAMQSKAFEVYNEETQVYDFDMDLYNNYSRRINGLSIEAKLLFTPNKRTNQSLKDRKYKI